MVKLRTISVRPAEHLWGDDKTIKYGKILAISTDNSENQSIIYNYLCSYVAITITIEYENDLNDFPHTHAWNDTDIYFDKQLEYWSVEMACLKKLKWS